MGGRPSEDPGDAAHVGSSARARVRRLCQYLGWVLGLRQISSSGMALPGIPLSPLATSLLSRDFSLNLMQPPIPDSRLKRFDWHGLPPLLMVLGPLLAGHGLRKTFDEFSPVFFVSECPVLQHQAVSLLEAHARVDGVHLFPRFRLEPV